MRLRTNLKAPVRFEGGDVEYNTMKQNKVTKPAFPDLLRKQAVPFNKSNSHATFPSLPLSGVPNLPPQPKKTIADQTLTSGPSDRSPAASVTSRDESVFTATDGTIFTSRGDSADADNVTYPSQSLYYDDFDEFELKWEDSELVFWADLELSTRYQIFTRLLGFHNEDAVGSLLNLSEEEFAHVQQAIKRRRETPFADVEVWKYLQTGNGIDPELIDRYYKDLTFDESYNEAYPVSFQRAIIYLKQLNLTPALLGKWCLRSDDSGMLTCIDPSVAPVSAKTRVLGHDTVSSADVPAAGAVESQQALPSLLISITSKPSTKRQRQPSTDSIDKPAQTQNVRPKKAPKKKAQPSDPVTQVSAPVQVPVMGPSNRPRGAPDRAVQLSQPPMLHKPVIKKHARPHPIHTEHQEVATASDTMVPTGITSQPPGNNHRSAGKITLRDRSRLRPTGRGAEIVETPENFSDPGESDVERVELAASPSSPFVTLNTKPVPKLKVNDTTGRAEVSSSLSPPSPSNEFQKVHEGPSMEYSPLSRNRSLPPNAAEAIVEDRRRSSTTSQSTDVTTISSELAWRYPEMMHDPSVYTRCFKLMPKQDQARLLEIHPARRNIVQTWLIYGVEAWNKHRLWNSKFPQTQHHEPAPGEQWIVNAAGPVVGRSMAMQWNWCQALGLSHNVFADELIGEMIIKGFNAAHHAWLKIIAASKQQGLKTPDQDPSCPGTKRFHAVCDNIQAQLWQTIKAKYLKYLTPPMQDKLNKKPSQKVILFNFKPLPQLEHNSKVEPSVMRPSTPAQTFVKSNENAFTSKALGLSNSEDESSMAKTPDSRDLGPFAQNSTEGKMRPQSSPVYYSPNEITQLQHRGADDPTKEDITISDANAVDLSPSVRRQARLVENKKVLALNPEAALPTPRTSMTSSESVNGLRKPSIESPAFSPINQEEVVAFFHASIEQTKKDASQNISTPAKPSAKSQEAQHQDPQPASASAPANMNNEAANAASENNQPKPTKIKLKLSSNTTANINPPTTPTPNLQREQGRSPTISSSSKPARARAPAPAPPKTKVPRQKRQPSTSSPRTTRASTASRNSTPSTGTRSQTPDSSLLSQSVLNATSRSHSTGLLPKGGKVVKNVKGVKKGMVKSKLQIMTDANNDNDNDNNGDDDDDDDVDAKDEISAIIHNVSSPAIITRKGKAKATAKEMTTKATPKPAAPKMPGGPRGSYKT